MRVAVLEDDKDQNRMIQLWLEMGGHSCHPHLDAAGFQKDLKRSSFDLLILDWELGTSSGIEVLEWVRKQIDWRIPVLFMTARDSEEDIVYALEKGADDYIVKPASKAVTLARINALARRSGNDNPQGELLEFGDLSINVGQSEVRVDGVPVELTDREFKLAVMLFTNVGRLISRDHLLENIWGITANIATRTVDTHVSRLRQKLHLTPEHGWQLKAIYQHGYRLEQLADSQVA